jgi:hypothetical protein
VGRDDDHVAELVDGARRRGVSRQRAASDLNAATVDDHVGRFRALADAGVKEAVIRVPDPLDSSVMEQVAKVIRSFQ